MSGHINLQHVRALRHPHHWPTDARTTCWLNHKCGKSRFLLAETQPCYWQLTLY